MTSRTKDWRNEPLLGGYESEQPLGLLGLPLPDPEHDPLHIILDLFRATAPPAGKQARTQGRRLYLIEILSNESKLCTQRYRMTRPIY